MAPLVAEAVVQVIDHGRIPGDGDQQVAETAHAVPAEHFQFVVGGGVALELAVGGAEDAVPEQHHFLLELAAGVNHPPGKVFRDAADVVTPLDKVAFRQIQLQAVVVLFRVQQFLDGGGVALGGPGFQIRVRGAESGPPHQVGHQGNILLCHRAYLLDRVAGLNNVADIISLPPGHGKFCFSESWAMAYTYRDFRANGNPAAPQPSFPRKRESRGCLSTIPS